MSVLLIDKFGLFPLMPEGSGQILSTAQLDMPGNDSIRRPQIMGQYYPHDYEGVSADTLEYKSTPFHESQGFPSKQIQIHEIVHRAAFRSGYDDYYPNSKFLKDNATTSYFSGKSGRILRPLIREVLAHSYEQGDDFDEKEYKQRVYDRAVKFNLKNPLTSRLFFAIISLKK